MSDILMTADMKNNFSKPDATYCKSLFYTITEVKIVTFPFFWKTDCFRNSTKKLEFENKAI